MQRHNFGKTAENSSNTYNSQDWNHKQKIIINTYHKFILIKVKKKKSLVLCKGIWLGHYKTKEKQVGRPEIRCCVSQGD